MNNKVFVGGLPWAVDDERLREVFSQFGEITDAHVATDKFSGRSRGFGFVEFTTEDSAKAAVDGMNNGDLDGRTIKVDLARPKREE
ncbi:RNA-binding protein [Candidatus Uhrbacteria bacterium]|nr:RNA-binding protein [Candidatus Uhrbacteria bacterium]